MYERLLTEMFQPAFANFSMVASCRLPLGKPNRKTCSFVIVPTAIAGFSEWSIADASARALKAWSPGFSRPITLGRSEINHSGTFCVPPAEAGTPYSNLSLAATILRHSFLGVLFFLRDGWREIDNSSCGVRHSCALRLVVPQVPGTDLFCRVSVAGRTDKRAGGQPDRKSTRLNSSHVSESRM